jgi:hypothetical protein
MALAERIGNTRGGSPTHGTARHRQPPTVGAAVTPEARIVTRCIAAALTHDPSVITTPTSACAQPFDLTRCV